MINSIRNSIKYYYEFGVRSNKKLIPIHSYISDCIKNKLNLPLLKINSLPEKEKIVNGKFYKKRVDICITDNSNIYGTVSIKFIMSNYLQNKNNYFENLIGELYNIKSNNKDIIQWFVIFVFDKIPYYDKKNEIIRYDKFISDHYNKLLESDLLDCLSIITISGGEYLQHPNKIKNIDNVTYMNFLVYDTNFEDSLDIFCNKLFEKMKK